MGTDDLFKKRREARKQRQYEIKTPKANSYLIVTEGKRTEPYYFNGLKRLIVEKTGGTVNVVELPSIDIHGEGSSTGRLIEVTEQLVKEAKILYQNIWVVFDKNDGVNTAIRNAKRRMADFNSDKTKPSEFDPGTTVYKLVEELKSYLDE